VNLVTDYMGLRLKNPLIAASSPLTGDLGTLRALEDHGAAAVVLPSIFEEWLLAERTQFEHRTEQLTANGFAEAQTYFPSYDPHVFGPERYLDIVRRAKEAIGIPVIASLNCTTEEAWIGYAREVERAGADGIELNVHFVPADLALTGRDVEQRHLDILRAVKKSVAIPVAVKIGPYFSAVGGMARSLADGGADALVLFNRFYQPDIDIATLSLSMHLEPSTPAEIRLPLLWIALLSGHMAVSLAATTGVETADEVFKYLLVGADAVMTASSLLRHGVGHVRTLLDGLTTLCDARGMTSIADVRGLLSHLQLQDATGFFERVNYLRMLSAYHVPRTS